MNNKIYPEFIEDFKNYVAGIKNLSAYYIDNRYIDYLHNEDEVYGY